MGVKEKKHSGTGESCNYNRMIRSNGRCELIEHNVPGIRGHMAPWPDGGKETQ